MKTQANALWPTGTCVAQDDLTTDVFDSQEEAVKVCNQLRSCGYRGEGKVFPLTTWTSDVGEVLQLPPYLAFTTEEMAWIYGPGAFTVPVGTLCRMVAGRWWVEDLSRLPQNSVAMAGALRYGIEVPAPDILTHNLPRPRLKLKPPEPDQIMTFNLAGWVSQVLCEDVGHDKLDTAVKLQLSGPIGWAHELKLRPTPEQAKQFMDLFYDNTTVDVQIILRYRKEATKEKP